MTHKRVLFESQARERVLTGARAFAHAVRVTLGPTSKRVPIKTTWGTPLASDDGVVIERMGAGTGYPGHDDASGRYVDFVEAGIIDPTTVVRVALENAVSVAGLLLLCEGTLVDVPEPANHSVEHAGYWPRTESRPVELP